MKRFGIILMIVLMISFLLAPSALYAADPALPTPIARVVWVKGTLKAVMPNNEVRLLQKMSVVYLRDTVMTDINSSAEIAFTDNSLMTFRPGTKMYIDQYVYQPDSKKKSAFKFVVNVIEGGFRTITGLIAKDAPDHYQVNTPVATIGVRGTEYEVAHVSGETYVRYYKGKPCVRAKNKKTQELREVCLSAAVRYLKVTANGEIMILAEKPDVFAEELQIVDYRISPFSTPGNNNRRGGPITSFCITR